MEPQSWKFKKFGNNWYLLKIEDIELFDELSELEDRTILEDEFDNYLINNIEDYIFEFPIKIKL